MHAELLGCGQTGDGQLGVRLSDPTVRVPERIIGAPNDADGSAVKAVACGEQHTIFLTKDGKMWSVGDNHDGQLGRGRRSEGSFSIYPVSLTSGCEIVQVAAGRAHSLAVADDGRVFAWGSNEHGQLGMASSVVWQESPKRVVELNEVVQVAAGADHCIALTEAGRVYVWGEQADGECLHTPQVVEDLVAIPIVRVLAGARHCVAISASGAVFTWGQNNSGELGTDDLKPTKIVRHVHQMDGLGVVEAACGSSHTVLLTNSGRTFSFGSDALGQCGFGKKIEKRTNPTAISDLIGSHVTRIAAGACHTVAVIRGSVYPFGLNSSGQLGNGRVSTQSTPRKTDDLDRVTGVFAGYQQTFFIRSSAPVEESEIVGPSCPVKYPVKITKEIFERTLKSEEKLDVIGLLESVFSSLNCINNSFLLSDDRRFNVGYERCHGVDLDQVMDTFMLIDESSAKQKYVQLIVDSFMMAMESWTSRLKSVEALRIFIIMPWLSAFTENVDLETLNSLHFPLFRGLCSLSEKLMKTMEHWWCQLSTRHFRRIVNVLKAAIRVMVVAGKKPFDCQAFLIILEKLTLINRSYHIVPIETFYVNEINSAINIKHEYMTKICRGDLIDEKTDYWTSYPFVLNGLAKMDLVMCDSKYEQAFNIHQSQRNTNMNFAFLPNFLLPVQGPEFVSMTVRRDTIVLDTMTELAKLSNQELMLPLKVKISGEEADDAGGVRKEFFLIVMRKILQPEYGMFVENEESHLVWFSGIPAEFCEPEQFHQLGRLLGLAVYNQVIVPFPFPVMLYKYLLDTPASIEDLCELSPTEGNGLQSLLDYEGSDVEDVFCLNFCITFSLFGEEKTVEMVPGGEKIPVTNANRDEYAREYIRHRLELGLNNEIANQMQHFRNGFMNSLHSRVLRYFQPRELMELVIGNENYDWSQLREHVEYKGDFNPSHPAIQAFWKAFFALDNDERKKFLQFLSGSTRLPVTGMESLNMYIQPSAPESLPVAHTCFNLLDLPNISDDVEMLRRLRISIEHTEGFTLV